MAVDPQKLLEQLEQEQRVEPPRTEARQPEAQQDAKPLADPNKLLAQLNQEKDDEKLDVWGNLSDFRKSMMEKIAYRFTDEGRKEAALTRMGEAQAAMQGIREVGQGVIQMGFDVLEQTILLPEGSAEQYTELTDKQREEFQQEFQAKFGEDIRFGIAKTAGKIVPVLLLTKNPSGLAPMQQTAATTGMGATVGAIEYIPEDSEEERIWNTVKSGGFALGLSTLFNAAPALRNFFKNRVGVGRETKFAKEGIELSKRTGVDLKLSQVTGDPFAEVLERVAQSTTKGEKMSRMTNTRQILQTFKFWKRAAKTFAPGQKNFGQRLQKAFDASLGDSSKGTGLLGARASQARKDFAAIDKAAGGKADIQLKNFFSKVDELIEEGTSRAANPAKRRIAKELMAVQERFANGKASAKELQQFLQTYGAAAKGRGTVFSQAVDQADRLGPSKALYKALANDLDDAAKGGSQTAKLLEKARNNYALNTDAIKALEQSAVKKLFSGKVPASNDELQQAIINMKPDKISAMMKTLSKVDPGLENGLRRFWLEHHISKAIQTGEARAARFAPDKLLKMRDSDAFKAIFNTPESRKIASDGISIARRVIMNNFESQGRLAPFMKEAAGVAASQDRTFVARLAADLFAPRAIAQYIQSEKGIRALTQMSKAKDTTKAAAALIQLNNISNEAKEDER